MEKTMTPRLVYLAGPAVLLLGAAIAAVMGW